MRFNVVRLLVKDVPAATRFYRDVMGLELGWGKEGWGYVSFVHPDDPQRKPFLALYGRDFMAGVVGTDKLDPDPQGQDKAALIFDVNSVDEAYEVLTARGANFVKPPHDQPGWGIRCAHLRDPEGNLIELEEALPKDTWSSDLVDFDEELKQD